MDDEGPQAPRASTFGEQLWGVSKELLAVVVGAVIVASLIRALVGQMFLIPSASMENTLLVQDRVVVEKLSTVKRGEVVVFADPGGWLSGDVARPRGTVGRALEFVGVLPDTSTEHLIKRVVGMPGDHVVCCDAHGRIEVNDHPLDETGYLYPAPLGSASTSSDIRFDVVVPSDRVFVLGDNRADSRDSRCHLRDRTPGEVQGANAFVPLDLVVGRAVAVAWPLGSAHLLRTPTNFHDVPAGAVVPPSRPSIEAGAGASC